MTQSETKQQIDRLEAELTNLRTVYLALPNDMEEKHLLMLSINVLSNIVTIFNLSGEPADSDGW